MVVQKLRFIKVIKHTKNSNCVSNCINKIDYITLSSISSKYKSIMHNDYILSNEIENYLKDLHLISLLYREEVNQKNCN